MTKLKIQVGQTSRRRLAGDMAIRNEVAFNQDIMTQIVKHTNQMSPLLFFSNVMGGQGQGSEDGMFNLETKGISSEFLRVDEYKTGLMRPIRVYGNSKVPEKIFANEPFEIEVDFPVDEDENLLLKDQKSMVTVRSVLAGTGSATMTLVLQGQTGTFISKSLLAINAPLNVGFGNSKGEASPNSNTLMTSEATRNSFYNPLVITRYVFAATGSYLSNDIYTVKATNPVNNMEEDFAIDLPVEFFRQVLASLERMMLYSVGNFDIQTLTVLGKSRSTRYSDRPSYLGIYQQLDDINAVITHSLTLETPKAGLHKIDAALRYIKGMTGGRPVVAAICNGIGAEFLRHVLKTEIQNGTSPIQFREAVGADRILPVGYRVKEYMSDHGTMIIYDMDDALTSRRNGHQFDQVTFNGISSDLRSKNIYFVPMTRMSGGKKVKKAQYFYKEGEVPGFGKASRAFVFGKSKGMTGQGNDISAEQAMNFQEDTIKRMMGNDNNRIDSTVDASEYHILTHGVPYINVDDAYRMVLTK